VGLGSSVREFWRVYLIVDARIVARFKDGELIGEIRTLDEFYNNLSEDEVNATDLTGTLSE